jgi:hypothetical protein
MRKLTAIAVPKKVAVATRLAGESIEVPLRPLPDVQPPAVFEPYPMSTPAARSRTAMTICPLPWKVSVSQP